ncbi:IS110 family transposase [Nocardia abscessus]|uniref:IS110 family transposase n=1 Tax=Nocardia abscessus TaxID=120957 RepID=UPI0024560927|nr:IS110 family transposase [Nocardia abscessus]
MSLALSAALYFIGIDWAAEVHAVCVMDRTGKVKARFTVAHTAAGITGLIRRLAKLGAAGLSPIAIERPNGRLVDLLLEAGHPVVPVTPNAIKAWREAEVVSGAKSDAGDAQVIAEYLRLRSHRLRPATGYSDATLAIRTLVRTRGDLVEQRVAATNQLSALLDAHWPGAKTIFADVESDISLAFLTRYPTAATAAGLDEADLAGFLAEHSYSGRRPAAALLARLRAAPAGATGGKPGIGVADAVHAMVTVLTGLKTAIRSLDRSIAARLDEHPDGKIFTSLPRSGRINAAQILAEWGDCRQAYDSPDAVAALAGATPVTKASGKHAATHFRWACNKRFRQAITTFADNSRRENVWAAHIYDRARASGKDHPHAVRILARAWIRVIWRCWHDGVTYDPAHHIGLQTLKSQVTTNTAA